MNRKHVLIIVAAALIVGSLFFLKARNNIYGDSAHDEHAAKSDKSVSNEQQNVLSNVIKNAKKIRSEYEKLDGLDTKTTERAEKVRKALAKFKERTDNMSREQIQREFDDISKKKKIFEERPTPEPKVEPFIDEQGIRWNKLIYENGTVRYELEEG
jgi:uncharacterized protein HemX